MSTLSLRGLGKRYGSSTAVAGVELEVGQGEMIVLLGPSGCGKTTTLRMIAGFVEASEGDILVDGRSILSLPPHKRDLGLVFQSYALFPHMTVARNLGFGLEMRGMGKPAIAARVADMLRLTRLEALAGRFPRELSGGQQQRVALGRALAIEPRLLLLDEPLSNLDAALRGAVGRDIRLMQRKGGLTTLMVTHDQDEAMAMADRLVVMKDGRVQQVGTQEDLYERPANPFVAGFIGRGTVMEGALRDGRFVSGGTAMHLAGGYRGDGPATLALRPERLVLGPAGLDGPGTVPGVVQLASYLGATREYLVRVGPGLDPSGETGLDLVVHDGTGGSAALPQPGQAVTVRWEQGAERLFDAGGVPLLSPSTSNPARIASHA